MRSGCSKGICALMKLKKLKYYFLPNHTISLAKPYSG